MVHREPIPHVVISHLFPYGHPLGIPFTLGGCPTEAVFDFGKGGYLINKKGKIAIFLPFSLILNVQFTLDLQKNEKRKPGLCSCR